MNAAAKPAAKILATCDRCEGAGRINGFDHYADGVCFACAGQGRRLVANYAQVMTPAQIAAAEKADAEERVVRAFITAHTHLSRAQVITKLGRLGFEKINTLRGVAAGMIREGNDAAAPMLAGLKTLMERFVVEDLRAA